MKHCKVELAKVKEILNLLDQEQLSKSELRNQLLELTVEERMEDSTLSFIRNELISKYFFAKFFYIYLFKKIVELVERFLRKKL